MLREYRLCASAYVTLDGDDIYLRSFYTTVCGIKDGNFERYWRGCSSTSIRHINNFREHYGLHKISGEAWCDLPVVKERKENEDENCN